jgi:predicted RNA polymerase sigma factor
MVPSWTVRLNRAIAAAMHHGPGTGLAELDTVDDTGDREWTKQHAAARADC